MFSTNKPQLGAIYNEDWRGTGENIDKRGTVFRE
jgi:hypothetical protein